jgi:transposase
MADSEDGLCAKPHFGPPPRLSDWQARQLEQLLRQGAHRHGWPTPRWTVTRVTELILRHFGLRYHPEHVRKILKHRLSQVGPNTDFEAGTLPRRSERARAVEVVCSA